MGKWKKVRKFKKGIVRAYRKKLGVRIEDLCKLFNLTEKRVLEITKGIEVEEEIYISDREIENLRDSIIHQWMVDGYTIEDMHYVLGINREKQVEDLIDKVEEMEVEREEIKKDREDIEDERDYLGRELKEYIRMVEELRKRIERYDIAEVETIEDLKDRLWKSEGMGLELREQLKTERQKVEGLERELGNSEATVKMLREDLSKKNSLEEETERSEIKRNSIRYTDEQKARMKKVYKQCGYNKQKTVRVLHAEGIDISYKHLGRIVKDIATKR